MWAFSRASRSLHYSCFLSNNSLMRVLWDPSLHGLGLVYIGCEDLVTYHSDFRITVFTTIPFLVVWFSLAALIWVSHHPCIFSLLSFTFDHLFSWWLFYIYSFLTLILVFVLVASSYPLHSVEDLTTFLFSYSSSLTLPLFTIELVGSRDYPAHHILHTRVLGLIIGYLSLISFHFFYLITLSLHYGPCRKTTLRPWD